MVLTMKVIAGEIKGHLLKRPKNSGTRPTSNLVREAMFSMLESLAPDWSRVLDLYAGAGALGIEALSRGSDWTDFVERSPRCCAIIKENLASTGLADRAKVYCSDVTKALSFLDVEYGIILLDPPYFDASLNSTLNLLTRSRLVGEETTIVVEHSSQVPLDQNYSDFDMVRNLRHGDTCISAYQRR